MTTAVSSVTAVFVVAQNDDLQTEELCQILRRHTQTMTHSILRLYRMYFNANKIIKTEQRHEDG